MWRFGSSCIDCVNVASSLSNENLPTSSCWWVIVNSAVYHNFSSWSTTPNLSSVNVSFYIWYRDSSITLHIDIVLFYGGFFVSLNRLDDAVTFYVVVYVVLGCRSVLNSIVIWGGTWIYPRAIYILRSGTCKLHHSVRICYCSILLDFIYIEMSFTLNFRLILLVKILWLLEIQNSSITTWLAIITFVGIIGFWWKSCHSCSWR